mgnify:CR=1 FL=1|jgi:5'(3')-deoxyribonucleotidase
MKRTLEPRLSLKDLYEGFLIRNYTAEQLDIIKGVAKEPPTFEKLKALLAKADKLHDDETRVTLIRLYEAIFVKAAEEIKARRSSQP